MSKHFIVDTNIFINDPECIKKFGKDNNVIIPMIVIEELDNFKNENSGRARAARHATRLIDDIDQNSDKNIYEGVEIENGGKLLIDPNIPSEIEFAETEAKNLNDTLLLQYAKDYDKKNKNVKLITEDMNLRLRAKALGLCAQGYKNIRVSSDDLYERTRTINCQPNEIDEIYEKGKLNLDDVSFDDSLYENEQVKIKANKQSVLGRKVGNEIYPIRSSQVDQTYGIQPRNAEQYLALDLLLDDDIKLVCLSGKAGVGKTLLALAAGMQKTMHDELYEKVTVARPTVAMGNELGFTPGTVEDKMEPWMAPIYDNLDFLFKNKDVNKRFRKTATQDLKNFDKLDVMSLTYIRGRSISDQYVIIDELQNCNPHEIKTIVTRASEGTKIVCTGDPYQIDNPYVDQHSNGLSHLIAKMEGESIFGYVNLVKGERSELAETAAEIL